MATKHIIIFGHREFAVDSMTAATKAIEILSKLQPAQHVTDGDYQNWHYAPEDPEFRHRDGVELRTNQPWREPRKAKAEKAQKPLALPKPKKGSILCICERSYVAPKESCPHCGRGFAESHNRIHDDAPSSKPQLRLL